jgi:hypothetical protein
MGHGFPPGYMPSQNQTQNSSNQMPNQQNLKTGMNSNQMRIGMGVPNYMAGHPPHLMMGQHNQQYFHSGMMGYGIPMRNDTTQNSQEKRQQQPQPPYPMYYPNPYPSMFMNPSSMIRQDNNNNNEKITATNSNIPPRQMPQNYNMIPHPSINGQIPHSMNSSKQNQNNQSGLPQQNIPQGMSMYMPPPYAMDPHFPHPSYMGYNYMAKKG